MDTTTIVNLVLSVVVVALAIVVYISKKSRIAMYVGVGFALFGVSHFMTFVGLATSLADVLLVVRTLGYLVIIFALYTIWKP